jgi:hypothetical protein
MIYALSWYIQDFLLVLGTGKVLVPEVFLLSMVFLSLYRPGGGVEIIWWAFFGGVLWEESASRRKDSSSEGEQLLSSAIPRDEDVVERDKRDREEQQE